MNIQTNTDFLKSYLDKNKINYSVDNNPSPEKVSRIKTAIARKKVLMDLAVSTYKQVFRVQ